MVIWRLDGQGGKAMSWRPQGVTDHGNVVVLANFVQGSWQLECEVPGWESRDDQWRTNCAAWVSQNAIRLDDEGVARITVEKVSNADQLEKNLARMASLLGSAIMAAAYLRNVMGIARPGLANAA